MNKNTQKKIEKIKMNAKIADEHVFVDSTVVNKPSSANKDPNEIRMKFPPSIAAKDLILKPIDGKKPRRSPNAFIIYRKLFVQTARANGYNLQMTEISKTASKSWENEADYVKKYYKRLAKDAYKYRSEMFPKTDRRKKRQQWNIVSFKSTSEEQESNNDTDSSSPSILNQSPLFSSPVSPVEDVFNLIDDNHINNINNNDHINNNNDHIIYNNQTQNNELNEINEINGSFPFNISLNSLNSLNAFQFYTTTGAIDLQQQTWPNEELTDPQIWSSPELSTSNSFSPQLNEFNEINEMNEFNEIGEINEMNEFNEIGEINEYYSQINILNNDFYYDETTNQNNFEIDTNTCINYNNEIDTTNTCINYNNEMNSNHPLWFQSGNFPMILTEEQNHHNSSFLF
ncbi:hypothetical protein C2G38_2256177 [Gigaspora rosea]|uniref:HMG box domain-containing protein n=1 Tax=Gigaspora rosea TaxID=44941 RepID=A0A397TUG9_9GLOM|nr:hypothetical protein C2G38_2256177 [Gigaspora rosea]